MSPKQLAHLLTSLETAADVVDAIDDRELQMRRDWDLSEWRYELIPWGVRFRCEERRHPGQAEILAVLGRPGPDEVVRPAIQSEVESPGSVVVTIE